MYGSSRVNVQVYTGMPLFYVRTYILRWALKNIAIVEIHP